MAATEKIQLKITLAYQYSSQSRTYTVTKKNPEQNYSVMDFKDRIYQVNANMPDYFSQTFISDEYDPATKITAAQYIETQEEIIYGHQ